MKKLLLCLLSLMSLPIHAQSPIFFQTSFIGLTAAAPTFSPTSPYTGGATTVTISDSTPGASILYCVDTTNTCTPATTYTAGLSFSSTEYIRASATASGYNPSPVASWSGTFVVLPSVLQSNFSTVDCTGGTCTTTLPSHAAGGMTCLGVEFANTTAPTAVSNTASFTWSAWVGTGATTAHSVWISCATTLAYGTTDTFTVTFPASTYHGAVSVIDASNVSTVDASATNTGSVSSVPTTGTFAVTGTNDLLFGVIGASSPVTAGSGFTVLGSTSGDWSTNRISEYQQITGASAVVTGSGASSLWNIVGVALK